jgi:glycosyltransferase involved in cell wall biosynthesis
VKVLIASRLYPSSAYPSRGTFVHEQARFLSRHCDLEIISPIPYFPPLPGGGRWSAYGRVGQSEQLDGLEVRYPRYLSFPRRLFFQSLWRRYLGALQRAAGPPPDLIHAHLAYPDGLAAIEHGRRLNRPVIISVHGHDVREIPRANPRWRALVARALAGAKVVIASSGDVRERVCELGVAEARIRSIPQGVDTALFHPQGDRQPGAGGWQLLYVGRFDSRKGVGVLLEAMRQIRRRRSDVRLRLVGGSPVSGTAADFRTQVRGLEDCVEFVDEKPHEEIPALMAAADLFVLPSFYDSFGIVLVEAMACGVPVVATRCGGPEDIVAEGMGELVTVGDEEDLARGILAALDGYEGYDREEIRRLAVERYDYGGVAKRIYEVYEEVLGGA